eukprot:10141501-Alexandrium_andersonii.AAC.1
MTGPAPRPGRRAAPGPAERRQGRPGWLRRRVLDQPAGRARAAAPGQPPPTRSPAQRGPTAS